MRSLNQNNLFYVLLISWFIIDIIQISFSGILFDEAYYYVWGQYLDWGYFDHPPLVGALVYLGDLFFDGSWSVRFFSAVLHVFTVLLIWKTIDKKYKPNKLSVIYFFGIAFTMPMFSAYGFITAPDSALLFFFALSAWAFKNFIARKNNLDILWLSFGVSGMILSKYHAFLVLFLALMGYWQIVKDKRFWFVFALVILVVTPHFIWLYEHDFITFKYHLFERSQGFKPKYLLEYLAGQLGVLNPYFLVLFLVLVFRKSKLNDFHQVMKFIALGTILFFALMTIRGRAEAHWTTIASIPMIFFLYPYIVKAIPKKTYLKYIIGGFVVLIFGVRILIAFNKLPGVDFEETRIEHYQKMNAFVEQRPVIFIGSYQESSSYAYANRAIISSNKAFYRKRETQFDIWSWDKDFIGEAVFIAPRVTDQSTPLHRFEGEVFRGWFVDYFQDSRAIDIKYDIKNKTLKKGGVYDIDIEVLNTSSMNFNFKNTEMPLSLNIAFIGEKISEALFVELPLSNLTILSAGDSQALRTSFKIPQQLNNQSYIFEICISSKLRLTTNSKDIRIEVVD